MCDWIFLPSLDDASERVCGDPEAGNSQYCAAHYHEMLTFIASDAERSILGSDSRFST
jgi:hypothetical protein